MAEWSIAAVLKTVDLHGSGGSNPSLSAQEKLELEEFRLFLYASILVIFANIYHYKPN